jgi:hypothetical protein
MSTGAVQPFLRANAGTRASAPLDLESDLGTLLGLYHGYDQARIALARLVSEFGGENASDAHTCQRIWSRAERQGVALDLFDPPATREASGITAAAHAATLSAFAVVCEKAEELLRTIQARWPELCEDAGGPLPAPVAGDPA